MISPRAFAPQRQFRILKSRLPRSAERSRGRRRLTQSLCHARKRFQFSGGDGSGLFLVQPICTGTEQAKQLRYPKWCLARTAGFAPRISRCDIGCLRCAIERRSVARRFDRAAPRDTRESRPVRRVCVEVRSDRKPGAARNSKRGRPTGSDSSPPRSRWARSENQLAVCANPDSQRRLASPISSSTCASVRPDDFRTWNE